MSLNNKLLGYPDDARLLIINADDFGMCHAINEAIFHTLKDGIVVSTTLMVPCPWALEGMKLLKANPDLSFGVHLTIICDSPNYRWRSLTGRHQVGSLIDETGYFFGLDRMAEMLAQANIAEVELEFRAQLATVLAAGLKPTHLDWHCLHNGGRADIFELTVKLAKEYGLAVRANEEVSQQLQNQGLPANDYGLLDSFSLNTVNKSATYAQMLRDLPDGLTEWAVHPGLASPELEAIEPGNRVRQTDYEFLISPETRQIIEQEGIILLNYKLLQQVWQATR